MFRLHPKLSYATSGNSKISFISSIPLLSTTFRQSSSCHASFHWLRAYSTPLQSIFSTSSPSSTTTTTTIKCHRRTHSSHGTRNTKRRKSPASSFSPTSSQCMSNNIKTKNAKQSSASISNNNDESRETTPMPKSLNRGNGSVKGALSSVSSTRKMINWYPGHIAKAERNLHDSIKMVDVVIEVRDCRIPISTAHPLVSEWLGSRSRIVALNRADLAPESARSLWRSHYISQGDGVHFVNAKQGRGVREIKKAAIESCATVNEKRKQKGLLPRPVRCLVMGFPNVGKSALINKLVGKNSAKSANKPGVTRNYQWIRISPDIDLLDMPGIIPAKLVTQQQAIRLAICDDIGHGAYDSQIIAALLIDELNAISKIHPNFFNFEILNTRFGVIANDQNVTGEDFLHDAAQKVAKGDLERTAVRLLTEFRSGMLGPVALEAPDMILSDDSSILATS